MQGMHGYYFIKTVAMLKWGCSVYVSLIFVALVFFFMYTVWIVPPPVTVAARTHYKTH